MSYVVDSRYKKAVYWFRKAADQGDKNAKEAWPGGNKNPPRGGRKLSSHANPKVRGTPREIPLERHPFGEILKILILNSYIKNG